MGTLLNGTNLGGGGGGSGSDENVKVSANDTTSGKLNGKMVDGTNTTLQENNDGGNETLQVNVLTSFANADDSLKRSLSTGLINGGEVSINANPALFDIAAGNGIIVDNWTDPNSPVLYEVSWSAMTGVTPTFLATAGNTFLLIDTTGSLVQTTTFPVNGNLRDKIQLGSIIHPDNTTITDTSDFTQAPLQNVAQTMTDYAIAIGVINEAGNEYFGTTGTLQIEKTAGISVYGGINYKNNKKDPNRKTTPAKAAATQFVYTWRDGSGGYNTTLDSTINVALYDDGTGGVSAPTGAVSTNQWVIDRISYSPDADATLVQYGQNTYNTSASALTALANGTDAFEPDPQFSGVPLRAFLVRRGGGTDLSLAGDAIFKDAGKFGSTITASGGGSGVVTLQSAYENSGEPEIITDTTRNSICVRRGTLADTDNIICGQNGAGTETFSVTGNGDITANSASLTSNLNMGTNNITNAGSGAFTGTLTSATLNTGQGDNELYAMNQNVQTTDNVTFNNISPTGTVDGRDIATDGTKLDTIETGAEVNNISDVNATDLTDGGDSTLHFHASDRARANHTGTQTMSTISDAGALATLNTVGTTQIDDDAVTLGKMASGTAGNLITYDASGNPAAVATGTSGQVLTSNGAGAAPTFQDVAGGGGKVLQMVTAKFGTIQTTTSSTYADLTNATLNITPESSTSSIILVFSARCRGGASSGLKIQFVRDASVVQQMTGVVGDSGNSGLSEGRETYVTTDTFSGTAARTYKVQIARNAGSNSVGVTRSFTNEQILMAIEVEA